jgi:hypothetical protein
MAQSSAKQFQQLTVMPKELTSTLTQPIEPTNPPTTLIAIIIIPLNKPQIPSQQEDAFAVTPRTKNTKQLPSVGITTMSQ